MSREGREAGWRPEETRAKWGAEVAPDGSLRPVPPPDDDSILQAAQEPLRAVDLRQALHLTVGDRNRDYGDPVENYAHTAAIFNAITGRDLTAREAALMMVAVKLARLRTAPLKADSHVDAMAYLGIVHECAVAEGGGDG